MKTIDADTHVIETDATWDYVLPSEKRLKPVAVTDDNDGLKWWLVEGQKMHRAGHRSPNYAPGVQELTNIPERLAHMDRLGVDVQVIFPSFFNMAILGKPEVEVALCRGYNRWLADVTASSGGRLQWAIVPPYQSMDVALQELEFGRQHGGCAVKMKGIEIGRALNDPYFDPIYARAQELDLPIAIHVGNSIPQFHELVPAGALLLALMPNLVALHTLLVNDVPKRFPKLRFAFLESGSNWLPFVIQQVARVPYFKGTVDSRTLAENRMYVACEVDDDLPYVLKFSGADNLVMGTDFGHTDAGTDVDGFSKLRGSPALAGGLADKLLSENPRALYNF